MITEVLLEFLLFIAAFSIFILVVKFVLIEGRNELDDAAFSFMRSLVSPSNNNLIRSITRLGNHEFLITANLLLIFYFLVIRKNKWYSIKIPSVALSSVLVMMTLKAIFNRPRPLLPLLEPAQGLSFPSGHAMSSVTFYGLLIYIIWNADYRPWIRNSLSAVLVLIILSIGLSRIYLRVHYASDVIAGFCAGVIWLTISLAVTNRMEAYSKRNLKPIVEYPPK